MLGQLLTSFWELPIEYYVFIIAGCALVATALVLFYLYLSDRRREKRTTSDADGGDMDTDTNATNRETNRSRRGDAAAGRAARARDRPSPSSPRASAGSSTSASGANASRETVEYQCPDCLSIIPEDAVVCPVCGAEFEDEIFEEQATIEYRCSQCGATVSEHDIVCGNCGQSFITSPTLEREPAVFTRPVGSGATPGTVSSPTPAGAVGASRSAAREPSTGTRTGYGSYDRGPTMTMQRADAYPATESGQRSPMTETGAPSTSGSAYYPGYPLPSWPTMGVVLPYPYGFYTGQQSSQPMQPTGGQMYPYQYQHQHQPQYQDQYGGPYPYGSYEQQPMPGRETGMAQPWYMSRPEGPTAAQERGRVPPSYQPGYGQQPQRQPERGEPRRGPERPAARYEQRHRAAEGVVPLRERVDFEPFGEPEQRAPRPNLQDAIQQIKEEKAEATPSRRPRATVPGVQPYATYMPVMVTTREKCPVCGTEVKSTDTHCPSCGEYIPLH